MITFNPSKFVTEKTAIFLSARFFTIPTPNNFLNLYNKAISFACKEIVNSLKIPHPYLPFSLQHLLKNTLHRPQNLKHNKDLIYHYFFLHIILS